ncbi:hypothetical protein MKW94_029561 [Papaver nudicaule]|uniref:Uncharacterized protein n=1 Tax=Papaver nudicaule TaxID=74823 RepID=A0AA41RV75_PAPNU|nr:hypothetical protein [Papaver nudicaule]
MARKNNLILCFFLVILIFIAGGKVMGKTCKEKWETSCVTEEDCKDKCVRDHGKLAIPGCVVRFQLGIPDLCECKYDC